MGVPGCAYVFLPSNTMQWLGNHRAEVVLAVVVFAALVTFVGISVRNWLASRREDLDNERDKAIAQIQESTESAQIHNLVGVINNRIRPYVNELLEEKGIPRNKQIPQIDPETCRPRNQ